MSDPVLKEAAALEDSARIQVNPPVFFTSAGLILAFAAFGAIFAEPAAVLFARVQAFIIADFGWFYVAAVAGFLVFVIYLMISRHGDVKLGPDESEPDYSYLSWFAMLFSAGMGIGLVFFGVAEPIQHYAAPPVGEARTVESARQAMVLTFLHWGFTLGPSTSSWAWRSLTSHFAGGFRSHCVRRSILSSDGESTDRSDIRSTSSRSSGRCSGWRLRWGWAFSR